MAMRPPHGSREVRTHVRTPPFTPPASHAGATASRPAVAVARGGPDGFLFSRAWNHCLEPCATALAATRYYLLPRRVHHKNTPLSLTCFASKLR